MPYCNGSVMVTVQLRDKGFTLSLHQTQENSAYSTFGPEDLFEFYKSLYSLLFLADPQLLFQPSVYFLKKSKQKLGNCHNILYFTAFILL